MTREVTTAAAAGRLVAMIVTVFVLVLLPASEARAGTLERFAIGPISSWTYTATSGVNTITITPVVDPNRFRLSTTNDTIDITSSPNPCFPDTSCGCTGEGTSVVTCPKLQRLGVLAGSGNDDVSGDLGPSSPLTLFGEGGTDEVTGGAAGDVIDGGSGVDIVDGGGGNDVVRGGTSGDNITGGSGTDTLSYNDGRTTAVTASLPPGPNSDNDTVNTVETLEGSQNADTLTGTAGPNTINGSDGNDILIGGRGADDLNGGDGIDTASYADRTTAVTAALGGGNTDNDSYAAIEGLAGTTADDTLSGDAAPNTLDGGAGDDVLLGLGGADSLIGGAGRNLGSYQERDTPVVASLVPGGARPDGDAYAQIQRLRGGSANDTLIGDGAENQLDGGPGDDVLIGGAEDDDLIGGGGRDTASYEERATPVAASLDPAGPKPDSDTYVEIQALRGGGGDDQLTGDGAANTLDGGAGADALSGLGGIDDLRGGAGNDGLDAVDGGPDAVDCGDDADAASVETFDSVTACEAVTVVNRLLPPPDRDGDGFNDQLDCNDFNAAIRPGALEIPGNAVDENCDKSAPDFPLLPSSITLFVAADEKSTRITELLITAIVAGGRVEVRCTPPRAKKKACPFKLIKRSFPAGRKRLRLTSIFKNRRLPVGTKLDIRALGPNAYGKVRIERIRKNKTTRQTLCLRPGAKKPAACPLS